MCRIYSFNFGQNVTKSGRITKRRSESILVELKFGLSHSIRVLATFTVTIIPTVRYREMNVFRCPETPSIFHQSSPNLEECIMAIRGVA